MASFTLKQLDDHYPRLGDQLLQARLKANLELEAIETKTNIRSRYLRAIEREDFAQLPATVYTISFVKRYARTLGLDSNELAQQFSAKAQLWRSIQKDNLLRPKISQQPKPIITPRTLTLAWAGLASLALVGYISRQVYSLFQPPAISITAPAPQARVSSQETTVIGTTQPGALVTINGQPTNQSADGEFSQPVKLQPGLNTLTIVSRNRLDKTSLKQIQILYERSTGRNPAGLPPG